MKFVEKRKFVVFTNTCFNMDWILTTMIVLDLPGVVTGKKQTALIRLKKLDEGIIKKTVPKVYIWAPHLAHQLKTMKTKTLPDNFLKIQKI